MTDEQGPVTLTDDELQGFARKLEAWGETLSPREQAFLIQLLGRAAAGDDVQGYAAVDYFLKIDAIPGESSATPGVSGPPLSAGLLLPAVQKINAYSAGSGR